jgi:hypothetical protein
VRSIRAGRWIKPIFERGKTMIELTIRLDTTKVEEAIRVSWQREFQSGDGYRDAGGFGWQEVVRQVKEHIQTLDLSAAIAVAAKAQIDDVVNDVVTVALREKAKQRAKEMMRDGTILDKV